MPVYCCVRSCKNNTTYNSNLSFFEFPKVWKRTSKLKKLSELRIKKWCAAINRKSVNTKSGRVCSTHFISGKCARLTDYSNPDWVPSLKLGRRKKVQPSETKAATITTITLSSSDSCKSYTPAKGRDRAGKIKYYYYGFPKVWTRYPKMQQLAKERLNLWLRVIKRKRSTNTKYARVCSRHFISGKSAHLKDYLNPDWVPTLHLGYRKNNSSLAKARFVRQTKRSQNTKLQDTEVNAPQSVKIRGEETLEEEFLEEYIDEINQDFENNKPDAEQDKNPPRDGINCCVPNCKNVRSKQKSIVKFFRFPSFQQNINDKIYRSERLSAWIKAINRIDITPLNAQYKLICSQHFIKGAPANADDKSNPDWIPNQKLPTTLTKAVKQTSTTSNAINTFDSCDSLHAVDPLAEEEMPMEDSPSEITLLPKIESMEQEIQQLKLENEMLKKQIINKDSIIAEQNTESIKLNEIHKIKLQEKNTIIQMLETTNLKISLSKDGFKNDDKKVNYFTGLPSFAVLEIIYNFIEKDLVGCFLRRINKFDALILVLMKLRLDLPLAYLGYRFGIAGNTAATIFHTNLKMLSEKIGPFIRWPEKNTLRENTSVYFKRVLGNKFIALIDFIEDPGPNVSQDYIIQRKYVRHKYLVAISPAGAITFVSKGYDSSLSVKEIAESCGVLDYAEDGDIILSDHGLVTHQVFSYNGCKVLVQSTDPEENDILDSLLQNPSQLNTQNSTDVDSSRVYIQQTISNLMNKFCVLTNKQKIGISKSYKSDEGGSYFDYVVRVCCALTNVSPAILSFETVKS